MLNFYFFVLVDEDLESSSEDDEKPSAGEKDDKSAKETEAGAEISALVNYVQPVHFVSFEITESKLFATKFGTILLKASFLHISNELNRDVLTLPF